MVVGVVFLENVWNGDFLEIGDRQVEILDKKAREIVFFEGVDLAKVIVQHLIRNFLYC